MMSNCEECLSADEAHEFSIDAIDIPMVHKSKRCGEAQAKELKIIESRGVCRS